MVNHIEDYPTANKDIWDVPFRGQLSEQEMQKQQVQWYQMQQQQRQQKALSRQSDLEQKQREHELRHLPTGQTGQLPDNELVRP